jgi:hypothetical protein
MGDSHSCVNSFKNAFRDPSTGRFASSVAGKAAAIGESAASIIITESVNAVLEEDNE